MRSWRPGDPPQDDKNYFPQLTRVQTAAVIGTTNVSKLKSVLTASAFKVKCTHQTYIIG